MRVAHERDGAGFRRNVGQRCSAPLDPAPQGRVVGAQDAARPREEEIAPFGRQRDPRQPIVDRAGSDRRVIVDAPQRFDQGRRRDHPADSQARQREGLGQAGRDDHALVATPCSRRLDAVELGATVDLVRHDPCSGTSRNRADLVQLGRCEACAGRVVRVADQDGPGALRHQRAQRIYIGRPARLVLPRAFAERPVADFGLQRPAEAAHLHVIRHHHHDLVRRLDQVHQRDEVRLRAAVGHQNVCRRRARVH